MAAVESIPRRNGKFINKDWLRQQFARLNAERDVEFIPNATPEMAQRMTAESMRARGIDPETLHFPQDDGNPDDPYPEDNGGKAAKAAAE